MSKKEYLYSQQEENIAETDSSDSNDESDNGILLSWALKPWLTWPEK